MRDNRYYKGQAFFVEEFTELLSLASYMTDRPEYRPSCAWISEGSSSGYCFGLCKSVLLCCKVFSPANRLFSREIFTVS